MVKKLLSIIFFGIFSFLFASDPIDLNTINEDYLLEGSDFDFYIDTNQKNNFGDIVQNHDSLFKAHHNPTEAVTNVDADYWIRFYLIPTDSKKILEVITPQTEYITLFIPNKKGNYDVHDAGYLLPFSHRAYQHKNFIFDFEHQADFSKPFFIKVHSSNKVGLLFKIRSQQFFTKYSLNEYLTLGLYYGILLLLIVYNTIVFLYLRKKVYLFYSFTVLFAIGLSLSDDGLGFAYLWPNIPSISQPLGLYVFPLGFLISYTMYAVAFLGKEYSKFQKIIFFTAGAYCIYFITLLIFSSHKVYYPSIHSIPFIIIYGCYVYVIFKHHFKPALFFVIGNTFVLLGVIIEQLRLLDVIEANIFNVYAFEIGIVLEFISLSISLAYRYAQETKLRITAQKKQINLLKKSEIAHEEKLELMREKKLLTERVNQELEEKVTARTEEVTELNKNLQKLVGELESMSITLDKENWELKKTIKEEKKAKLSGEAVTLEEVKLLFPTKTSCLTFLEQLKWKNGFSCSKCNHTNYSINKINKSRKCSKCGKIESVTSGSLYHSQKIPLQELFYLTHIGFKNRQINISDLTETLNTSETSIYKFLKKVKDQKAARPSANTWEDLIF